MTALWGFYFAPIDWVWGNAIALFVVCAALIAIVMVVDPRQPWRQRNWLVPVLWLGVSAMIWLQVFLVVLLWPVVIGCCVFALLDRIFPQSPNAKGRAA